MPAGAQARLWRALDRMKDEGVPASDVRSAEDLSIKLHQIDLALRHLKGRPDATVERYKGELAQLSTHWLGRLPISLSLVNAGT